MGQPDYKPVEKVGYEIDEAGSPLTLDNGEFTCNDSEKKKRLLYLSFLASLLIFISGIIFLYIAISDTDLNVELSFN